MAEVLGCAQPLVPAILQCEKEGQCATSCGMQSTLGKMSPILPTTSPASGKEVLLVLGRDTHTRGGVEGAEEKEEAEEEEEEGRQEGRQGRDK